MARIGMNLSNSQIEVAVLEGVRPQIILNATGERFTPAYVAFTEHGYLIGSAAKHQQASNMKNTIYDLLEMVGRNYSDPVIQRGVERWSFLIEPKNDRIYIEVEIKGERKLVLPEQILALLLSDLKKTVSGSLPGGLGSVTVAVPTQLNEQQRAAIRDAFEIAKLPLELIVNSTTAAARNFASKGVDHMERIALFCELNAAACIVQVVRMNHDHLHVVRTEIAPNVGSLNYRENTVEYFRKQLEAENQLQLTNDSTAMHRLRNLCTDFIHKFDHIRLYEQDIMLQGKLVKLKMSRSEFESINQHLFRQIENLLAQTVRNPSSITDWILLRNSSRLPKLTQLLVEYSGGKPLNKTMHLTESIALGAALWNADKISGSPESKLPIHSMPEQRGSIGKTEIEEMSKEVFKMVQEAERRNKLCLVRETFHRHADMTRKAVEDLKKLFEIDEKATDGLLKQIEAVLMNFNRNCPSLETDYDEAHKNLDMIEIEVKRMENTTPRRPVQLPVFTPIKDPFGWLPKLQAM